MCPTLAWFPIFWGAGWGGRIANVSIRMNLTKPHFLPMHITYQKKCNGWLGTPIGLFFSVVLIAGVGFAAFKVLAGDGD